MAARPEFTLKKIEVAGAPIYSSYEKQGKELEQRANGVKATMKNEIVQDTNNLFSCLRADLSTKREAALSQVKDAASKMQQTADTLKANGVDPSALTVTMDGVSKTLTVAIGEMQTKVISVSQQFDAATAQLDQNEKDAIAKIAAD